MRNISAQIEKMRAEFEARLRVHLDRVGRGAAHARLSRQITGLVREYALRGGKRLRPLLFLFGLRGFGVKPRGRDFQMAVAFELLHHFALMHDDIVDGSDTRRGAPAAHKKFEALLARAPASASLGRDMAMLAGDWLFAHSLNLAAGLAYPAPEKAELLGLILRTAETTAAGQLEEMRVFAGLSRPGPAAALDLYAAKTAYYSFACPLQAAAIAAGAGREAIDALERAGLAWGKAYQVKDDLDDFEEGAAPNPHLAHTFPLLLQGSGFRPRVRRAGAGAGIKRTIEMSGVSARCEAVIRGLVKEGNESLARSGMSASGARAIMAITTDVFT